jgi:hypothetical protein
VAAVALAVLLYERSGSALIASLGYATAFVPWAVGGPVLSASADRLPPRRALVGCDLARVVLIGLAAVPGVPLLLVGLLVLLAALLAPPLDASASALYPQVLEGDRYAVAISIRDVVHQSAQLVGFVAGGALVVLIGAHGALALDALTFALSAWLLRRGLVARPAAAAAATQSGLLREAAEGLRVVSGDPRLWGPLALGMIGSAYAVVPEAIAPAYAHSFGAGAATVGLIMASVAGGRVVAGVLLARFVGPALRQQIMWPLAVAGTAPLVAIVVRPPLPVSIALLALAGAASSCQIAANTAFAAAAPAYARGRAFGIAMYHAISARPRVAPPGPKPRPHRSAVASGQGHRRPRWSPCAIPVALRMGGPARTSTLRWSPPSQVPRTQRPRHSRPTQRRIGGVWR